MPDYQKGKIYCIRSHQTDKVYVGSTTQALSMRMCEHRKDYKLFIKNGKRRNVSSFDILEYDDAYIELIEDFACENKSQLEKREGHFIRELDCVNKRVAGRDMKEYYETNKDKISQRKKEYREANKDKINQRNKEYHELNKDKIYQQHKAYREANKDKLNQQQRERRLKKKQESNSI